MSNVVAGFIVGGIVALCGRTILILVEAIWVRRPTRVGLAAIGGAATADLVVAGIGAWLGTAVAGWIVDPGLRSTIAVGLFAGVAARILVGLLLGTAGVPAGAVLPDRPIATWARLAAIGLLAPAPALVVAGVALAWAGPIGTAGVPPLVVGIVAGAAGFRLLFASTAANRRGVRSPRRVRAAIGITAIGALAWLAVRALPG